MVEYCVTEFEYWEEEMKERVVLLLIIASLWVFLFIFQNYMPTFWALVFLCSFMFVYAIYMQIAFKHQKRKLRKKPKEINYEYKPFVTIMIPSHNEQYVIEKTVETVLELDYPNFEVIVIDDRSEDETGKVIKALEAKYEKVIAMIRPKDAFPGKSAVLNDAMALAKGEAILVFDSDARVDKDFLTKLVPALEPKDVGAVQARKIISNAGFNFLTQCQNNEYALDTHFQVGRDAVKGAVELRGNGELLKRVALEDIGGWNNYTITDDLDMSTRMQIKGWDVRFCPDVKVYEEGITKFLPLLRQRRRWVEGSIRRYLENFTDVLFSKNMSLRVSLDMTAYITEIIMPVWMMSEICFQAFRVIKGYENNILSSLVVLFSIGVCFWLVTSYSIRKYNKQPAFRSVVQAVGTSAYLIVVWFPLAMFIVYKIIFMKKTMNWGKTAHGVAVSQTDNVVSI